MKSPIFRNVRLIKIFIVLLFAPAAFADVTSNLIHHWQFDQTSGNIAKDSTGSADGTLTDGASWMLGGVHFDGIDDYIDLPDGFADFDEGITITLWTYPTLTNEYSYPFDWPRFVELGNGEYSDNVILARFHSTDSIIVRSYNGDETKGYVIAKDALELDTWQFIAASIDSEGNVCIYKNGTLIQTGTTYPVSSVTRTENFIGKSNWNSNSYYDGVMDDVRIYDAVLSSSQIQELASNTPADFPDVTEIWVDDGYTPTGVNEGHTWLIDAFDNLYGATDISNYGDTIYVNTGTYKIYYDSIELKSGVKIIGEDPNTTIIDGTLSGYIFEGYPVINCEYCDPNTLLSGITIQNAGETSQAWSANVNEYGGAIYSINSHLTIQNCIFKNNLALYGGAIYNDYNHNIYQMKIIDCTFMNNTTEYYASGYCGGAIYGLGTGGLISNCTFTGNSSYQGGALATIYGDIENCTFSSNSANTGGANCYGGAIDYTHGDISNCEFYLNTAYRGGAISRAEGSIVNCTFTENTADDVGGAVYLLTEELTITNSIFWENSALIYNEFYFKSTSDCTVSYCDIEGSGGSGENWNVSFGNDGGGNIDADPLFANASNNYHLKSTAGRYKNNTSSWTCDSVTSPCIDAGVPNSIEWKNELWPHGKRINMGAYGGTIQASMSEDISKGNVADLNYDSWIDLTDWAIFASDWASGNSLLATDLDRDMDVDLTDLVIFTENWLESDQQ